MGHVSTRDTLITRIPLVLLESGSTLKKSTHTTLRGLIDMMLLSGAAFSGITLRHNCTF